MSDKKAAAIVGLTTAGTIAAIFIISAKAKTQTTSTLKVQVESNPIPTILAIDGVEYETPTEIKLSKGTHSFAAIPKSPSNVWITYGFHSWQVNGKTISHNASATINLQEAAIIRAQYTLGDVGINAPAKPDSLPDPNGPMTPTLVNPNTTLPIIQV